MQGRRYLHNVRLLSLLDSAVAWLQADSQMLEGHIKALQDSMGSMTEHPSNKSRMYVTNNDITKLSSIGEDVVFAVTAPHGTTLVVPDPDEGVEQGGQRRYRYSSCHGILMLQPRHLDRMRHLENGFVIRLNLLHPLIIPLLASQYIITELLQLQLRTFLGSILSSVQRWESLPTLRLALFTSKLPNWLSQES